MQKHVRSEVGAPRGSARGVWRDLAAPHRALVPYKRAYPVACPFSQHGVAVLAAGDEHKRPVILQRRERQMGDGSCVSRCHEGDCFGMRHGHMSGEWNRMRKSDGCRDTGAPRTAGRRRMEVSRLETGCFQRQKYMMLPRAPRHSAAVSPPCHDSDPISNSIRLSFVPNLGRARNTGRLIYSHQVYEYILHSVRTTMIAEAACELGTAIFKIVVLPNARQVELPY